MPRNEGDCDVVAQEIVQTVLSNNQNMTTAESLAAAQVLATLYIGDQLANIVRNGVLTRGY